MVELKTALKSLKLNESNLSILLGAVVVLIIGILAFRWVNNRNNLGSILPKSATESVTSPQATNTPGKLPSEYTVKSGDSLWKISQQHFNNSGYNWVDIAKANNLNQPNRIVAGQKLTIPDVPVRTPKVVAQKPKIETTITGNSYTTVKGDSLWKIAVAAYGDGYKWTALYNANKDKIGTNPNRLFQGLALTVPR
ncbi:MAG: hypothetical protein UW69_C0008G0034 [Microgenomates group bacterium GW2011_GWA2_44_7]|uniref:LysM domain-containing protein n=1 Tax=Candidatus Woesebacteria bacterium GW2011_GWA1_43_12 TaxID=1618557 RepID=A0A0G1CYM8_9BACT|nr:MAG: hypothetical protein UV66_C0002G0029 [Candidatus Woesebacteria bacterium GW2011_GWA1_43_12]KKT75883.1 MAG: hypothetical protein UW69_C0008G0034 [Microgenomates group bacterium GW2011_GWA2_44_7]KKT78497.1 MAG: hypothetical protein UW73_C0002G0028 [Microgenomates group bacterium GW2011_GWB1_44_8]